MDNKDKNYIPPRYGKNNIRSSYGRRVTPRNEYDMDRAQDELREKRAEQRRKRTEAKFRKKKRMRAMRIRVLSVLGVVVIIALIILFFTPLLNIKGFNVIGNSIVETEEILSRVNGLKGTNLIMLSEGDIRDELSDISYIEEVSVAKYMIPPSASITVKECIPAARVDMNGYSIIIDPTLKVLSDGDEFDADSLAHIDGLKVDGYSIGKTLEVSEDHMEKTEVLATCLEVMNSLGMLDELDYIDLTDITNIRFGYDDRMDALCGTRLEIERKIRMFYATVTGNYLEDNAHGTIDLSTSGKAIHIP